MRNLIASLSLLLSLLSLNAQASLNWDAQGGLWCTLSDPNPGANPDVSSTFSGYDSPPSDISEWDKRWADYQSQLSATASAATTQSAAALQSFQPRLEQIAQRQKIALAQLPDDQGTSTPALASANKAIADSAVDTAAIAAKARATERLAETAEAFLAMPAVQGHFDAPSLGFLHQQIADGRSLSQAALKASNNFLTDFAFQNIKSVTDFLSGVASGAASGVYNLSHTIEAVARDPRLLSAIPTAVMNALSDPRMLIKDAAGAFLDWSVTMAHGNAEEKGKALGRLSSEVLISLATEGVGTEVAEVTSAVSRLMGAIDQDALGDAILTSARTTTGVAEEVASIERGANGLFGKSVVGQEYTPFSDTVPERIEVNESKNFLGQHFWKIEPQPGETFYRVGASNGEWWSREKPVSEIQARMDKAILPDWNDFTKRSEITIPPGGFGSFYEGIAAPQGLGFVGGTGQIYIPEDVLKSKLFQSLVKEGPFK